MTQSITLTASMRSNLASLESIQGQMDTTQTRLSTGKKVNSAIDNASSYYQSRALTNRAADLDSLLDSMGQGIQTIQAANEGIEAVTAFIEQAKSVANSAFALDVSASDYTTQLQGYEDQYNAILKEIGTLAKDSGYQGVNLLNGNDLTVMFNETRTHSLTVNGEVLTTELNNVGADGFSWDSTTGMGNVDWKADTAYTYKKEVTYKMASVTLANEAAYNTWVQDNPGVALYKRVGGSGEWTKATAWDATASTTWAKVDTATAATTTYKTAHTADDADYMHVTDTTATAFDGNGTTRADLVNKSLSAIVDGMGHLRDYANTLGNNFSIIQTRQDFTEALVDVLETGSDNLVLADMNEESANYLALQTRQQLAINSLALASQSAQSVLKLF